MVHGEGALTATDMCVDDQITLSIEKGYDPPTRSPGRFRSEASMMMSLSELKRVLIRLARPGAS